MDNISGNEPPELDYIQDFYWKERERHRRFVKLLVLSIFLHLLFVGGTMLLSHWLTRNTVPEVIMLSAGNLQLSPGMDAAVPGEPEPDGYKSVVLKAPAKLPEVSLVWATPRLANPVEDWQPYALEVLAGVLDGHGSARLPQALVKEQRIAVDVGAGYDPVSRGPALFMAAATP